MTPAEIRKLMKEICLKEKQESRRHEAVKQRIGAAIVAVRNACKHKNIRTHPGFRDMLAEHTCMDCGKDLG